MNHKFSLMIVLHSVFLGRISVLCAYCYRRSSTVCLSVTIASSAKTAKPMRRRLGCELGWAQGTMY